MTANCKTRLKELPEDEIPQSEDCDDDCYVTDCEHHNCKHPIKDKNDGHP